MSSTMAEQKSTKKNKKNKKKKRRRQQQRVSSSSVAAANLASITTGVTAYHLGNNANEESMRSPRYRPRKKHRSDVSAAAATNKGERAARVSRTYNAPLIPPRPLPYFSQDLPRMSQESFMQGWGRPAATRGANVGNHGLEGGNLFSHASMFTASQPQNIGTEGQVSRTCHSCGRTGVTTAACPQCGSNVLAAAVAAMRGTDMDADEEGAVDYGGAGNDEHVRAQAVLATDVHGRFIKELRRTGDAQKAKKELQRAARDARPREHEFDANIRETELVLTSFQALLFAQCTVLITRFRCDHSLTRTVFLLWRAYLARWRRHGWAKDEKSAIVECFVTTQSGGRQPLASLCPLRGRRHGPGGSVTMPPFAYTPPEQPRRNIVIDGDDDDGGADIHDDHPLLARLVSNREHSAFLKTGALHVELSILLLIVALRWLREPISIVELRQWALSGALPYMCGLHSASVPHHIVGANRTLLQSLMDSRFVSMFHPKYLSSTSILEARAGVLATILRMPLRILQTGTHYVGIGGKVLRRSLPPKILQPDVVAEDPASRKRKEAGFEQQKGGQQPCQHFFQSNAWLQALRYVAEMRLPPCIAPLVLRLLGMVPEDHVLTPIVTMACIVVAIQLCYNLWDDEVDGKCLEGVQAMMQQHPNGGSLAAAAPNKRRGIARTRVHAWTHFLSQYPARDEMLRNILSTPASPPWNVFPVSIKEAAWMSSQSQDVFLEFASGQFAALQSGATRPAALTALHESLAPILEANTTGKKTKRSSGVSQTSQREGLKPRASDKDARTPPTPAPERVREGELPVHVHTSIGAINAADMAQISLPAENVFVLNVRATGVSDEVHRRHQTPVPLLKVVDACAQHINVSSDELLRCSNLLLGALRRASRTSFRRPTSKGESCMEQ